MKLTMTIAKTRITGRFITVFLLVWVAVSPLYLFAQMSDVAAIWGDAQPDINNIPVSPSADGSDFRIEKISVAGGAEIVTIFAKTSNFRSEGAQTVSEIPLISVLRDTLGDERSENDRLRYVWMLSYTRASFRQKAAAFVPFLYTRTTNKAVSSTQPPPPVADMHSTDKALWSRVLWVICKRILKDEFGPWPKASAIQYRQNAADYKLSSIAKVQTILSLYESTEGEKLWSESERRDIQAKLWLTEKPLGAQMQSENLGRAYDKNLEEVKDVRGHNWELLRQYSEAQGLYFEPLTASDGVARNAIVWAAAEDLAANRERKFDSRFLNIKNPWADPKLSNWKGYSQVRWFDEESRIVEPGTPNAKPRTMIPLALYGLDHPKIPILLVDFRDNGNAKRREMSKRVLNDVLGNVLSISRFSSIPYFLGRFVYDFATGRRAMDMNQKSRVRSYAQLKLLLALDSSLDRGFRNEIAHRLEKVSLNPLENDIDTEAALARKQYQNLIEYAKRPEGLPAKLDLDRRAEMVRLAHNGKTQTLFDVAQVFSLGLYTHREKPTPDLVTQLDIRRQLDFHERVLQEIAYKSAKPEVDSDVIALRHALQFISQNGSSAKEKTTHSLAKIFAITSDESMRTLCLAGLYRIDNSSAKKELLAIYINTNIADHWRNLCAQYLKKALVERQRISASDAITIAGINPD